MKTISAYLVTTLIVFTSCSFIIAQETSGIDSTGLPGDNFSLQGALELFKNASSPEDFEKKLNTENNYVNNLDLNEDGEIDYIHVINKSSDDAHAFVLQIAVSETENQDIAVIELEKTGKESAVIQILGDEDIYGLETIVEPIDEDADENFQPTGKGGPNPWYTTSSTAGIVINVWSWPCVRFVYAPAYRPWVSPYKWRVYPAWWKPWRPLGWRAFHPHHVRHHHRYGIVHKHRLHRAHKVYTPGRASSVSIKTRHAKSINHHRVVRTKTTITGPKGKVKVTKTKTRVKRR